MSLPAGEDVLIRAEEESIFARDIDGQLVRLDPVTAADLAKDVQLKVDGRPITVKKAVAATNAQGVVLRDSDGRPVPRPTTIYDAANQLFAAKPGDSNPIPVLCHQEHLDPVAVCRICVVEIAKVKDGKLAAA